MAQAVRQFLEGLVDAARVRAIRPSPIIREPSYKQLRVPDSLRSNESSTLVEVESAEEIAAILKKANEERMPVYVRQGSGYITLDLPRPEPPGSLILDLRRLRWIRPDLDAAYVEIGPTVTERELNDALAPHGFSYPELVGPVTWGGLVSLNTSGRSVDPYVRKPGDYLLGLEVVLPTGEIVQTGTRAQRRPCGVDLTNLFTGFQAIVGVITNLRLRLVPAPRYQRWGTAHLPSVEAAGRTVCQLYRAGLPFPHYMEFMERWVLEMRGFPDPPGALLVIGTDGWTSTEAEAKLEAIFQVAREQGASEVTPKSEEERQKLYRLREGQVEEGVTAPFSELGVIGVFGTVMDCPLPSLVPCIEATGQVQRELKAAYPGLHTSMQGHIGGGMFHPLIYAPLPWGFERLQEVARDIRERMLALQLQFDCSVGEQGIFPQHAQWFVRYHGEKHLEILQGIKDFLDPYHILNDARFPPPQ